MGKLRILHLEDSPADKELVEHALRESGIDSDTQWTSSPSEYLAALDSGSPDFVLLDNGIPGFNGLAALRAVKERSPDSRVIFVTGFLAEKEEKERLAAGAVHCISKEHLWRLGDAIRLQTSLAANSRLQADNHAMNRLITAVQDLSLARQLESITAIVRRAARELIGADGATFVLRDADQCHYADEDAIAPLWKGQRFPMSACVSGWVMTHAEPAIIEDIYADPRVPADAYRPTFVKSLVMVPIRTKAPIGAIGTYWAKKRRAAPSEIELLQALANTTAVAMENVQVYAELEKRVRDRTTELEIANRELESFCYSVSHDLRAPLRCVKGFAALLNDECKGKLNERAVRYLSHLTEGADQMGKLIDDLLRLSRLTRAGLSSERVNVSRFSREILERLRSESKGRSAEFQIRENMEAWADPGLLRAALENLLSNAWKYSSKTGHTVIQVGHGATEAGYQTFFVRDNGVGFDMRYSDKLFAPFQRLHSEREFAGSGIGLATVRRVIERHAGKVWAEAEPGKGATFSFSLPAMPRKPTA